uniref:Large ribosomal subunit protein bL28c n=1 Tax=Pleurostichidium falkenbergii TaxID=121064 RepID=A0A4D6UYT1_9FLOR|nr:ribosomal protein L28 [Pleurostichidium falkenbergii]QCH39633.1 ribosomal protein L28 [Pleurostichidium falkenbergii]
MSKVCEVSSKTANNGYKVSHSNGKTKNIQNVNLHKKKVWSLKRNCWIKIKVSSKVIKSLHKIKF